MLTELDYLPEGSLRLPAHRLHEVLKGPTLIHLPGRRKPPLFVSILLHGNEDVGLQAMQTLLQRMETLPRALSIFIGNVGAARHRARFLPGQPDFNRVWPGGDFADSCEARTLAEVVRIMAARGVFASVDVHNNTGLNPHYACINRLDHSFLQLALLFSRTVVYFVQPTGVQSMAFAELCPATTLECGKPGYARGGQHAADYLEACLRLAKLPAHPVLEQDIDLFHTIAVVKLPPQASFSFGGDGAQVRFDNDLDRFNFHELPAGTVLAGIAADGPVCLTATGERGEDVTHRYFANQEGRLTLKKSVMPSMLTLDEAIVRQDCLCYLMERVAIPR